jgi:putative transposase
LTWFFNLVMQLEAIQQSGAEPYERNEARTAQRNGYKERSLKTRVGELILKKPQFSVFADSILTPLYKEKPIRF